MSAAEKETVASVVDTMVSYGLSYTARAGADERGGFSSELALDPPLDLACALKVGRPHTPVPHAHSTRPPCLFLLFPVPPAAKGVPPVFLRVLSPAGGAW